MRFVAVAFLWRNLWTLGDHAERDRPCVVWYGLHVRHSGSSAGCQSADCSPAATWLVGGDPRRQKDTLPSWWLHVCALRRLSCSNLSKLPCPSRPINGQTKYLVQTPCPLLHNPSYKGRFASDDYTLRLTRICCYLFRCAICGL